MRLSKAPIMKPIALILCAILLSGCAGLPPHEHTDANLQTLIAMTTGERREAYLQEALDRRLITGRHLDAIRARRVIEGMNWAEVGCAIGLPDEINDLGGGGRKLQELVYKRRDSTSLVYLENNTVTAFKVTR